MIVTCVPPAGGPEVGLIEVTTAAAVPLKASPLVSTAAQKLSEEHDTEVRLGLLSPETCVELHGEEPPLQVKAYP